MKGLIMPIAYHYIRHKDGRIGDDYAPCASYPCPQHKNGMTGFMIPDDRIDDNDYIERSASNQYKRLSKISVIMITDDITNRICGFHANLNAMGLSGSMTGEPLNWYGFNISGTYDTLIEPDSIPDMANNVQSMISGTHAKAFIMQCSKDGMSHILTKHIKDYQKAKDTINTVSKMANRTVPATYCNNELSIQDYYPPLSESDTYMISSMLGFDIQNAFITIRK